ncbi:uncharacterized protein LOC127253044 [Andrographis paniculata]|uniref:uncharacterized protein LOC127253044 n=1 Tax=Andrographis paniculata TaxID=175694 RepID=UPI0021E8AFB4|nr:uncharacterized protein LOC127253044 [Andrographis paniculata]
MSYFNTNFTKHPILSFISSPLPPSTSAGLVSELRMAEEELCLEGTVRVIEASLSQIKWRLKHSSKSRLQVDILALLAGMRPCIMVDYGGMMPELGDHLCAFLNHCRKESSAFELLRVMVIDDMVYLIHVKAFADFVKSSLCLETPPLFVNLEHDPPKMVTSSEESPPLMQLLLAQKMFSSVFLADKIGGHLQRHGAYKAISPTDGQADSVLVDLSCHLKECQVTIPTLNGWLLGYPVIYLFGKDCIHRAVYNLSTKSLHIYQIFVDRSNGKGSQKEELMSFTVPYELSLEGGNETWARSFYALMQARLEKCRHIWRSVHMEVISSYPQAIAL